MDTREAAAAAHVTAATIRAWCRIGAVAATKTGGRWIVDADSLGRRIALGLTTADNVHTVRGTYTVGGHPERLAAAFAAGRPVRIAGGICAGDTVYLGLTATIYGEGGITLHTEGLMAICADGTAEYAIDTTRLQGAPRFAAALARIEERAAQAEARRLRAEDDYLNPAYE